MSTVDTPEAPKYCLVTLSSEEIVQKWEQISPLIECSIPPTFVWHPGLMSNFLASTQTGAIELHVFGVEGQNTKPLALVGTTLSSDTITRTRSMLVVCLTSLNFLSRPSIWDAFIGLMKMLAKSRGCSALFAYSNVKSVIDLVQLHGGTAEFTFLRIGVD